MMTNNFAALIIGLLALLLTNCNSKKHDNESLPVVYKVDDYDFKIGKKLDSNEWKCNERMGDIICVPNQWKFIDNEKTIFFYDIGLEKKSYIAVLKYSIDDISIDEYLNEVVRQLETDSVELLDSLIFHKLVYVNNVIYQGEFLSKMDNNDYITYSVIFENKSYIYDISLKVLYNEKNKYDEIFKNIIYNFKPSRELLIKKSDTLREIIVIDKNDFGDGKIAGD